MVFGTGSGASPIGVGVGTGAAHGARDAAAGGASFGDWAQASKGGTQALTGLFFRSRKKRTARKAEKLQREMRLRQFNESMGDSLEREGDVLRDEERSGARIREAAAARGVSGGSIERDTITDQKYATARRLNSIQRARAMLKHGYEAGEKLRDLQEKMAKIEEQEAVMAATIDTAISLAQIASDRELKEAITVVPCMEIARRVVELPVSEWQYKGQIERHIGPMAQDFQRVFGKGDGRSIPVVDALGTLFAIVRGQQLQIEVLKEQLVDLKRCERVHGGGVR